MIQRSVILFGILAAMFLFAFGAYVDDIRIVSAGLLFLVLSNQELISIDLKKLLDDKNRKP